MTRARLLLLVAAVVIGWLVVRLVGRVDWDEVWTSLKHLAWWQAPVLAAVLVVRRVLNAWPLALFIPGVSVFRATLNDQRRGRRQVRLRRAHPSVSRPTVAR